jgi:hypothetical protein
MTGDLGEFLPTDPAERTALLNLVHRYVSAMARRHGADPEAPPPAFAGAAPTRGAETVMRPSAPAAMRCSNAGTCTTGGSQCAAIGLARSMTCRCCRLGSAWRAPIRLLYGGRKKRRNREWERDEAWREEDRQIEADQTAAWLADDGRQPLHVKLPAGSSGATPPGAKT